MNLKFLHMKSDKAIARQDKKTAVNIRDIINKIENLEKKIPEDIQKGDIDGTMKDVVDLLNYLEDEERNLEQLEKDSAIQDYDLLKEIGRIEDELQKIQSKKEEGKDLSAEIQNLKDLSTKIQGLINKARIDARNAKNDREKILKYKAFLGYHQLANDIRGNERDIKDMISKEKALEMDIKHHESDVEIIKKDVNEFVKVAEKEAQDIYKVEHDDIVFTFYVINKLQNVYNILIKLKQEGFPEDKEQLLEHKYAEVQQMLQKATNEAYKMEKYMKKRAHKLAA